MLLGEIGLPPGAEVDRDTLEQAVRQSGWEFSHYEILPDKVILYLWPRRSECHIEFQFRPRLALRAQSAPSKVYDYYNPDSLAVVPPASFVIQE